jgi:hypothetical protein
MRKNHDYTLYSYIFPKPVNDCVKISESRKISTSQKKCGETKIMVAQEWINEVTNTSKVFAVTFQKLVQ